MWVPGTGIGCLLWIDKARARFVPWYGNISWILDLDVLVLLIPVSLFVYYRTPSFEKNFNRGHPHQGRVCSSGEDSNQVYHQGQDRSLVLQVKVTVVLQVKTVIKNIDKDKIDHGNAHQGFVCSEGEDNNQVYHQGQDRSLVLQVKTTLVLQVKTRIESITKVKIDHGYSHQRHTSSAGEDSNQEYRKGPDRSLVLQVKGPRVFWRWREEVARSSSPSRVFWTRVLSRWRESTVRSSLTSRVFWSRVFCRWRLTHGSEVRTEVQALLSFCSVFQFIRHVSFPRF